MKIRIEAHTFSPRVSDPEWGTQRQREGKIERVAFGSAEATVTTDKLRVVVEVTEQGRILISTKHLAASGDPESKDSINWIDDASLVLTPDREPEIGRVEPLPY